MKSLLLVVITAVILAALWKTQTRNDVPRIVRIPSFWNMISEKYAIIRES